MQIVVLVQDDETERVEDRGAQRGVEFVGVSRRDEAHLARETQSPLRDAEPQPSDQPSTTFLVQVMAQDAQPLRGVGLAGYGQTIDEHRDAAAIGSLLYRQAGAEPEVLSGRATFLSLAV